MSDLYPAGQQGSRRHTVSALGLIYPSATVLALQIFVASLRFPWSLDLLQSFYYSMDGLSIIISFLAGAFTLSFFVDKRKRVIYAVFVSMFSMFSFSLISNFIPFFFGRLTHVGYSLLYSQFFLPYLTVLLVAAYCSNNPLRIRAALAAPSAALLAFSAGFTAFPVLAPLSGHYLSYLLFAPLLALVPGAARLMNSEKKGDGIRIITGMQLFIPLQVLALFLYLSPLSPLTSPYALAISASSPVFVLWGDIAENKETRRKHLFLDGVARKFRLSFTNVRNLRMEPAGTALPMIVSGIGEGACLIYKSRDGIEWSIQHSYSSETISGQASTLKCDLRTLLIGNNVYTNEDEDPTFRMLSAIFGKYFICSLRADDGYRMECLTSSAPLRRCDRDFFLEMMELLRIFEAHREAAVSFENLSVRLMAIISASRTLFVLNDGDSILKATSALLANTLHFEACSVWRVDKENALRIAVTGTLDSQPEIPETQILSCARLGEGSYVSGTGGRARYLYPIMAGGNAIAVLDIISKSIDSNDQRVIEAVSSLSSLSIELLNMKRRIELKEWETGMLTDLLVHDLKNLLQPALLNMQTMQIMAEDGRMDDAKFSEMVNASIKSIREASTLAIRVIGERRKEMASTGSYVLADAIHRSISTVRGMFPDRRIELNTSIDEEAATVVSSPLIDNVFVNLFSNAVKYNSNPTVRLFVSSRLDDGFAKVSVSDNGRGIKEEKRDMLFNPYNKFAEGTGLGLSLVKSIMQGVGGSVEYAPQGTGPEGEGSTFILRFPIAKPAVALKIEGAK